MKDLGNYLYHTAFTGFVALPDPTQRSLDLFSGGFLKQYTGGFSTNEAALQGLKNLSRDAMPIYEFGINYIISLFKRANGFALYLQLHNLRGERSRTFGEILIMKSSESFDEAILICSLCILRLRTFNNLGKQEYVIGARNLAISRKIVELNPVVEITVIMVEITVIMVELAVISMETTVIRVTTLVQMMIISETILDNRKVRMNLATVGRAKGHSYVDALMPNGRQLPKVFVDIGSMICSIDLVKAQEFGLLVTSCPGFDIAYGNGTIQHTDSLAAHINSSQDLAQITQDLSSEFRGITAVDEQQALTNAPYKHRIETGGFNPVATRDYRRPLAEIGLIDEMVIEYLQKRVIEPSDSPCLSPVELLIADKYPILRVSQLVDQLNRHIYFTTIDLITGLKNIMMYLDD
ncbi:uncharacterized protein EV154DRAFT_564025 [Mucor mucedo]|uniref:uncharacterized protein n=1 Tax=Mucor mucedo TaxID=29922 RepID=UPI00221E6418|nr:uncharacterized protein EV154DRAFT_564025 [Mucor mucedo]KAI7890754.1 hypothetical protein EV154DRAFT_564025 [Mucor mucedo]